jgi:hypothetical protein
MATRVMTVVYPASVAAMAAAASGAKAFAPLMGRAVAPAMVIRWQHDAHLFGIAVVAFGLAVYGWLSRRRRRPGWERHHAVGMGGSCIALLTGFYVDNGPQLAGWRLLPHWSYWLIPAAVGAPLIRLAVRRFHAGASTRPRGGARSAASPPRPGSPARR